MQPFSRHAGSFASLRQVEDRLAAEQKPQPQLFSDSMSASPLFLGPATGTTAYRGGGESSGPALDFHTLSKGEESAQEPQEDSNDDDDNGEDIAMLMALLRLSPPGGDGRDDDSGGYGFLAKVIGVVGPKCDKEKGVLAKEFLDRDAPRRLTEDGEQSEAE